MYDFFDTLGFIFYILWIIIWVFWSTLNDETQAIFFAFWMVFVVIWFSIKFNLLNIWA